MTGQNPAIGKMRCPRALRCCLVKFYHSDLVGLGEVEMNEGGVLNVLGSSLRAFILLPLFTPFKTNHFTYLYSFL